MNPQTPWRHYRGLADETLKPMAPILRLSKPTPKQVKRQDGLHEITEQNVHQGRQIKISDNSRMITPTRTSILITGANGQLGRALSTHFQALAKLPDHSLDVICLDRAALDLADPAAIQSAIKKYQPHIIINAAAHTAVDQAEIEPERAHAINAQGPTLLAQEAKALGATLIHYSTDYVFEGSGEQRYLESDACAPRSVYGHSKRAGEIGITESGAKHLIFRTSWVYAEHGANFMLTMLKLATDRETLSVIDDQWGAPTWVGRIVAVTDQAVQKILKSKDGQQGQIPNGIFHLSPGGETTWYRYAAKIFALTQHLDRKFKTLAPITSEQYETNLMSASPGRIVAKRPHNSRLDCSKLEQALGLTLPSWEDDLTRCIDQLKKNTAATGAS
jgi:dTDP-4-dehydrorhamnose reductase